MFKKLIAHSSKLIVNYKFQWFDYVHYWHRTQSRCQIKNFKNCKSWLVVVGLLFGIWCHSYAQDDKPEPVIINGDVVEYSTDSKEVTASGNVVVDFKGTKLSCQKLTLNTSTKDGQAEGNVRLEDKKGVIEGEKMTYNFQKKFGTITDSQFRASPYFGRAERTDKIGDAEFVAKHGYFTTCSYDNPHYRIKSRKIDLFPGDKIQTKDNTFYAGHAPLFYLPQYNHNLKDPLVHVQIMPGKDKKWGPFMLTAWRYNLTEDVKGRIYFDYRGLLGVAEGFGVNYTTNNFGKGDYKYYYTQERDKSNDVDKDDVNCAKVFQRYLIRWRHKWNIDENTDLTAEYYKIADSKMAIYGRDNNFLKDYFPREYEKETQPPSYVLLHRAFNYSSMDFFMQKRTNRWYDSGYVEKLPEIKYTLPSLQIGESPFYFDNSSSIVNLNRKNTSTMTPAANPANPDVHVNRFDISNKFSLPMKVAFFRLTPFVMNRETFYDKYASSSGMPPRTIFYTGTDLTTKFYRIFNVPPHFLGMDINSLRHIITPTIGYVYNREPTITSDKIKQIDEVDSISRNNSVSLELSNKLQTKRTGRSVDFLDLKVNSNYIVKPKTGDKRGSNLSDILFDLRILPYSWLSFDGDATYKHSGLRSDTDYNHFTNANYDIGFNWTEERYFTFGQRYQRKGGNDLTQALKWRINPKWVFSAYQRRNIGHDPSLKRGLREQEYTISRDLHCWVWDITYNQRRGEGETIWFIFRLKAFPELEFEFNKSYHAPKPGSQSNP